MRRSLSPTITDVAKRAGVSIGTVSGVIHGKTTINPEIRERVKAAISALGYVPNAVAQGMRLGSTRTVGVVVPTLVAPAVAAWVSSAQDVFHDAGYAMLLAAYNYRRDRELDLIRVLVQRKADALLVVTDSETDGDLQDFLRATGVPVVLIDREAPDWADAVVVDHRGATRRATDYLLQLGHRRIALIAGGTTIYPARERIEAYEEAHVAAGIPADRELLRTGDNLSDYGYQQTLYLRSLNDPPTAIIVGGPMLSGVLRALARLNLRVPDDVSIVASSESELAELTVPSVSIERWNPTEVGLVASRLALDRIRATEPYPAKRVLIPSEFVLRDSCAPPRSKTRAA
jgi:LacI family transcriptional regulator